MPGVVPALIGVVDIPWPRAIGKSDVIQAAPAVSTSFGALGKL